MQTQQGFTTPRYTERATRFLVEKSNEWNCSPKVAAARIIDNAAAQAEAHAARKFRNSQPMQSAQKAARKKNGKGYFMPPSLLVRLRPEDCEDYQSSCKLLQELTQVVDSFLQSRGVPPVR